MSKLTAFETRDLEPRLDCGDALPPGSRHYRAFVGPQARYDLIAALQFNLLTALGLREQHFLLDIGCGSLRAGRLLIPYLLPGRYFGIEPEEWLVDEGLRNELGEDILAAKRPTFSTKADFGLSAFEQEFDFLLAHSIFSHASPSQVERCLSEARRTMHPESLFVATFISGDENHTGDSWTYPGCVSYRPEFIRVAAQATGLACGELDWPHPHGQQWLVLWHPERSSAIPTPPTAARIAELEGELTAALHHYRKLSSHPYVRLGLSLRRLLPRARRPSAPGHERQDATPPHA